MVQVSAEQVVFQSSSPLSHTYLGVQKHNAQPLCGNVEGWGPVSDYRWDLTPCFLDVWILVVSLWGILGGLGAILYLYKKSQAQPVKQDWHFYTKLSVLGGIGVATIVQAALQVEQFSGIWFGDIRFWTTIINLLSLVVISYVQYLEHWRLRYPNGIVLTYWLFLIVAYAVKLRSLVSQELHKSHMPYFATFAVSAGLAFVEFVLEWLVPKRLSAYDALGDDDECPIEYANIFSILTFSWMTPLMKYGYKEYLTQDDLWNLRKRDTTRATSVTFEEVWEQQLEKKKPSLWIAMIQAFGGPYFRGAVIKTVSDCLNFVQPQLLRFLITFVDSYRPGQTPQPPIKGAAIALAMFAVSISQTAGLHQYFPACIRNGHADQEFTHGCNLQEVFGGFRMKVELPKVPATLSITWQSTRSVFRILRSSGNSCGVLPFKLRFAWRHSTSWWVSGMLAGVGVMIAMIPINGFIAKISKTLQKKQMKNKDARTRLMTEILNNMKSIKLYAWGQAFMSKLNFIRNDRELHTLRKIGAVTAIANFTMVYYTILCVMFDLRRVRCNKR